MTVKVRIKAGLVEFEYEGETELGVADIKDLFTHIEMLFKLPVLTEGGDDHASGAPPVVNGSPPAAKQQLQKLHVNSIATKLQAKTGADVALAAAAALQIYDHKETFTRSELLDMMKKATMHYKENMSGNLTAIIKSLIGSKINQISDGVYSLTAIAFQELESQLA